MQKTKYFVAVQPGEIFKPYPLAPDKYLVSNFGRVWSASSKRLITGRPDKRGYYRISVADGAGGRIEKYVHRMVCETFLGEPKPGQTDINHIDCDINNNRLSNLEYCTRAHNQKHAYANGLRKPMRGPVHVMAKLTQEQADEIRARYAGGGTSHRKLAREYGVSNSIIGRIIRGVAY